MVPSTSDSSSAESVRSYLSEDAIACITPESGLLIKSLCSAMSDPNLFVQRGFFDLLLTKMPLNSAIFDFIIGDKDKEILFFHVTSTVLKKDMSLNRRLWNWLLGPEPSLDGHSSSTSTMTRLEYFQKYSYKYLLNSLLQLITVREGTISNDELVTNFINVCNISISIMDRWEIGQTILPKLFIPILKLSKYFNERADPSFAKIIKHSNQLFDGIETHIIWLNILQLIENKDIDLVLFILKYYNVEEEEMLVTHIPLILLAAFASFEFELKWARIIEALVKLIPQRALLPLDASEYATNKNVPELNIEILKKLNDYYSKFDQPNGDTHFETVIRPYQVSDLSHMYLCLISNIMKNSLTENSLVFLSATKIYDDLIKIIPVSEKPIPQNISTLRTKILNIDPEAINIEIAFGITNIFKYLIKDLTKLETLRLLKILVKSLWKCLLGPTSKFQVEIVEKFWNLEMVVGSLYLEAAICELLIAVDFETRISMFNILWVHLNTGNLESRSVLQRPLFLILEEMENDIYLSLICKWIKSTNSSGTLNKIFRIISMELFNNEFLDETFIVDDITTLDLNKIAYDLKIIYNLLKLDDDILNNFKLELCVIDNSKQVEFIKTRNWDISTYKSFMIIVLSKFMELDINKDLVGYTNDTYLNYLKCVRLSLKLINLLIDGSESNFKQIFISLVSNCEENCIRLYEKPESETSKTPDKDIVNSYYLETIVKMVKLSSKNQNHLQSFFEVSDTSKSFNLLDFLTIGIKSCNKAAAFNNWIELILSIAEYYPDLIFQICNGIIDCMCSKIETEFLPKIQDTNDMEVNLINEPVCELILGIEKILMKCHKYLGYMLTDTFGFNNLPHYKASSNYGSNLNSNNAKETSFFGSVIQGVFQIETADEKNEGTKRKRYLIETFRRSIFTVYQLWVYSAGYKHDTNEYDINNDLGQLTDSKTISYGFGKIKFRCRKIIEQSYLMEPLETIESLLECYQSDKNLGENGFKLFQILDDCKQQIILTYLLDSLVSRVNYVSLEEDRRSSLISKLSEFNISFFLVEYAEKLSENENYEQIWNDIQTFLKDAISNTSSYKYIYSNILRFLNKISVKILKTKHGQSKRINKDISESFIKLLNLCLTIKIGPNQNPNTLSTVLLQNHQENEDEASISAYNKEKIVFRQDVCIALKEIIPFLKVIINDNDKLLTSLTNIVSGLSGYVFRSGAINFTLIPDYVIDVLVILSKNDVCREMKPWKSFCQDVLNDTGFFEFGAGAHEKWNIIMKNWILNDESRINDMANNKLILPNSVNNSGTLLFNWNDGADILNGNIPVIQRLIYLLLINEKDSFISVIGTLISKLDVLYTALRQVTNYCQVQSWIMILLRCIVLKFSDNHIIDLWTLINKSMFFLFTETYEQLSEEQQEIETKSEQATKDDAIFDSIFLQTCKLLDVLVVLDNEEFQLSEWVFISDSIDGIFKSTNDSDDIGIIEKISKYHTNYNNEKVIINDTEYVKKVPILKGVTKLDNFMDLKRFFRMLKIRKYENDYDMKAVDFEKISGDLLEDLFTV